MRRVPAQARSRERLERILDAAEEELGEVGYEAATMQSIAERAGTSIGSVYQFYPNKKTLLGAISERYIAKVRELLESLLTPESLLQPWIDTLENAIDDAIEYVEIPGHTHDYYKNAPELTRDAWKFLSARALTTDPKYAAYGESK